MVEDTFKVISMTPGCADPLEARLVPTLVSILEAEPGKISSGLQTAALDILQTMVRARSVANKGQPLSQLLVATAFPAAVRCTLRSEDNSVTQVLILFNIIHVLKLSRILMCLIFPEWRRVFTSVCVLGSGSNLPIRRSRGKIWFVVHGSSSWSPFKSSWQRIFRHFRGPPCHDSHSENR